MPFQRQASDQASFAFPGMSISLSVSLRFATANSEWYCTASASHQLTGMVVMSFSQVSPAVADKEVDITPADFISTQAIL
jgi:hypothetical protein